MQLVSVFLFFLHLLSPKTNHSQCGVRQYRRDQNPYRNLFKFRVTTWVKVWVRVKQVVIMVMESLQGMNSTLCNVPTSDENEVVCVCVCATRLPMEASVYGESNISRLHWFWNKHLRSYASSVLLPSLSGLSTRSSFPISRVTSLSRDQRITLRVCLLSCLSLSLTILRDLRLGDGWIELNWKWIKIYINYICNYIATIANRSLYNSGFCCLFCHALDTQLKNVLSKTKFWLAKTYTV